MKKYIFLLMAITAVLTTACDKESKDEDNSVSVTGVTLDKSTLTLIVGETSEPLEAIVIPNDATDKNVTWKSNNENVATVDAGKVTAKSGGTAIITVTSVDGGKTATCSVTVVIAVDNITLDPPSSFITIGDVLELTVTITPDNASNKTVTWETSNRAVATVTNGKVTAVSGGIVEITATTKDGDKRATSTVMVRYTNEPEMIFVKGGTFQMGCTGEQGYDCRDEERPVHPVTLNSFYIGKYEVTQRLWVTVMGSNPSVITRGNDYPVQMVSWYDVQEFINRLNTATGKKYRLPTEAEWEYAARGGNKSKGYKYSGSDNIDDVAWNYGISIFESQPVGTKLPNELGIYDMSGNVSEWCSDWYGTYPSSLQTNPSGASSGTHRVKRGGSWLGFYSCSVVWRDYHSPNDNDMDLGFRVVHP